MRDVIDKARVLVEALPYLKEFRGRTAVVKIGGAALDDLALRRRFAEDVVLLSWVGIHVVVVHGGGVQVTALLDRLGHRASFVNGMRVTDADTLEVVEMVLGGTLNKELVRLVQQLGGRAVGLTGKDGNLARARRLERTPDLGLVGEVTAVDRRVIDRLLPEFIPIVAPIACADDGQTLNVNADPFAAAIAVALGAEKLVLLTDVPGVVDGGGALIPSLTPERARELIATGAVKGGMIPKIENALAALEQGVRKVHIIDGRLEHALLLEIFTRGGVGTELTRVSDPPPATPEAKP
ncbi:MAG TPA: acetylglutamate kinase [Kofleriaceae bacterium]|nr:acetylglutamate kinase [Kofleriaceae bacterium]